MCGGGKNPIKTCLAPHACIYGCGYSLRNEKGGKIYIIRNYNRAEDKIQQYSYFSCVL